MWTALLTHPQAIPQVLSAGMFTTEETFKQKVQTAPLYSSIVNVITSSVQAGLTEYEPNTKIHQLFN